MKPVYTFNPQHRHDAIRLAAQIAADGHEATTHCGASCFGASPYDNWVSECAHGDFVARHYYNVRDGVVELSCDTDHTKKAQGFPESDR